MSDISKYRVRGEKIRVEIKSEIKKLLFEWLDRLQAKKLDEKRFIEFLAYNRYKLTEAKIIDDEEFDTWTNEWLGKNNV